jgi:ribonuclease HII
MIFPDIELEKKLWKEGKKYVVGIDEAGRGPLAGPVCAGAVVIDDRTDVSEIVRDSKKMTAKQREKSFDFILGNSLACGVCMIGPKDIDRYGIQKAVQRAMQGALSEVEKMLGKRAEYLIVDGTNVESILGYDMLKIKGGDIKHYSISCASVLAKVTRDRYMIEISKKYPEYGFDRHMGYGTKQHIEAITKYGPCDIHRRSFSPIKDLF